MVNFKFRWIPNMSSGLRLNKEKKSRVTTIGPIKMMIAISSLNPNWHEEGHFYPLVLFGLNFVSRIFIKNFQTFLEVKVDINRVVLTPFQAH